MLTTGSQSLYSVANSNCPHNLASAIRVTDVRRAGEEFILVKFLPMSCLNEEGEFVSPWQRVIFAQLDTKVTPNTKCLVFKRQFVSLFLIGRDWHHIVFTACGLM